jgi:hypothetical protein
MVINVSNRQARLLPSPVKGEGLLWFLDGRFKVNGTAVKDDNKKLCLGLPFSEEFFIRACY